jgi:hypothetical protein
MPVWRGHSCPRPLRLPLLLLLLLPVSLPLPLPLLLYLPKPGFYPSQNIILPEDSKK